MSEQENPNEAPFSLIKYEAEIEISENIEEYQKAKLNQKILDPKPSPQDVLNNMIVPRDWKTSINKFFMQYASHQKPSRDDVLKLKDSLEEALEHRQARKEGICPIKEELFSEAFDEIIRQVTINSPERGLLLMRVRDEHKMTMAAYQTLYQESVSFGVRKQIESEQGMHQLAEELEEADGGKQKLRNKKIELESKKESLQKKIQQRKAIEREKREEEIKIIQTQAQNLQKFLESVKEAQQEQKKQ